MARFDRPIPGQSLTETPKNRPYERPPEIADAEKALQVHLLRLSEADRMEATLDLLEEGLDIVTVTEAVVRNAVMNGVHSLDVGVLIAPVIHEYIKSTADDLGVKYEEGFDNKKDREQLMYTKRSSKAKKMLESMDIEAPKMELQEEQVPEKEVLQEQPAGLMARI